MTRSWIQTLALIAATALTTAVVQSAVFAPATRAASSVKWEYAELTQDPTQLVYRRAGKEVSVATDITRKSGDVWEALGDKASVPLGDDLSQIGFLNSLGRSGWELFDVSTHVWSTAASGVTTWTLRRQK